MYEGAIQDLIDELGRLPGVGPKSAQRIAFHVLSADPTDVKRDEGYLFWLGWTSHIGTSLFSTSDAQGPYRRSLLGFDCRSALSVVDRTPLAEPLYGLTNTLADPALCGNNQVNPGPLPLPPKKSFKGPVNGGKG